MENFSLICPLTNRLIFSFSCGILGKFPPPPRLRNPGSATAKIAFETILAFLVCNFTIALTQNTM